MDTIGFCLASENGAGGFTGKDVYFWAQQGLCLTWCCYF